MERPCGYGPQDARPIRAGCTLHSVLDGFEGFSDKEVHVVQLHGSVLENLKGLKI